MKPFNRERFLFWLLAVVLGYQALFFGFALYRCGMLATGNGNPCPEIGARFDSFSERTLAAVLGLIAGGAAIGLGATQRKPSSSDPDEPSVSQRPQPLQPPSGLSQRFDQPPAAGQTFEGRKKKDPKA